MKSALLFDIDGTLLYAKGLGRPAFAEAFQAAYGTPVDLSTISFVGATDTAVIRSLARTVGIPSTPAREEHFFIELTKRLEPRLKQGPLIVYPGVRSLLKKLQSQGYLLGVVTGNIRSIAWAKLLHAELAPYFSFGAYATDHENRDIIAKVAQTRAHTLGASAKLLIGDTTKDVQAAHAIGVRCLAVTTGWVDADTLRIAGADDLVDGFNDPSLALAKIERLCHV